MKKIYILTLLLCFTSLGSSFAQTLKGHIYDANTNEPLVGAAVTYKLQGNQGVVSDIHGAYEIKLPEGGVDLVFSYVGYEDVLMPIVIDRREGNHQKRLHERKHQTVGGSRGQRRTL